MVPQKIVTRFLIVTKFFLEKRGDMENWGKTFCVKEKKGKPRAARENYNDRIGNAKKPRPLK